MTIPNTAVNTFPYCGACGYDVNQYNVTSNDLCDSCGGFLSAYGLIASTAATAGIPGSWDGWAIPFADFSTIVADPLTTWTTGQYIKDGNGDNYYWDGAAWQAGEAP